jgi:hypothetical protein
MFVRDHLPELCADLVAAVPSLDVRNLATNPSEGTKLLVSIFTRAVNQSRERPLRCLAGFKNAEANNVSGLDTEILRIHAIKIR